MRLKEEVIHDALARATPDDLDVVLTTIETYRTCVRTAERLARSRVMQPQKEQVVDCARSCENALADYAATGRIGPLSYPLNRTAAGHFIFEMKW